MATLLKITVFGVLLLRFVNSTLPIPPLLRQRDRGDVSTAELLGSGSAEGQARVVGGGVGVGVGIGVGVEVPCGSVGPEPPHPGMIVTRTVSAVTSP